MQDAEHVPRMPLCPASLYLLRAQLAHIQTLPVLQEPPAVRDESWKRDAVRAIQTVAKLQSAAAFLEPVREEEVCLLVPLHSLGIVHMSLANARAISACCLCNAVLVLLQEQ